MRGNPVASHLQHFFAFPEAQAVRRASFDTSRRDNVLAVPVILLLAQRLSVAGYRDRLIGSVGAVSTFLYLRGK
jgi:hypothetical protein